MALWKNFSREVSLRRLVEHGGSICPNNGTIENIMGITWKKFRESFTNNLCQDNCGSQELWVGCAPSTFDRYGL